LGATGATSVGLDLERRPQWSAAGVEGQPRFVEGGIEQLPLRTASVDALFCFSVLQYVDRRRALDEFARVLKPGARFVWIENLARHPGALLHRVWRRRVLGVTSGPTVARGYPSWRELEQADSRFAKHGSSPHALFTPLLFACPGVETWPADAADHAWTARMVRTLERWDRFCFDHWPGTRARAWLAMTLGTR
jgi:SAM-dependent methyltransferase